MSRYQGIAHRVAWLVARQAGEAEDAVQEAFVKAYYALPRFRPGAPFRPWLLRIVANEAKNRARSTSRREGLVLRAGAVEPGDAAPSPEGAALAREDAETLALALGRLREPDRLVIAYRYLFELSEAEVADALGVRPGTVKSRLVTRPREAPRRARGTGEAADERAPPRIRRPGPWVERCRRSPTTWPGPLLRTWRRRSCDHPRSGAPSVPRAAPTLAPQPTQDARPGDRGDPAAGGRRDRREARDRPRRADRRARPGTANLLPSLPPGARTSVGR